MERDPIIVAAEAKQLLDNALFQGAFKAVGEYIETKALSCDPDNKEAAQRVVLSKQILAGIKREIERLVESGLLAEVQLSELEKRRKLRLFQR